MPRIKHSVLWKFQQSLRQHTSICTVFCFFSIETFQDRKVFTQKEVMFQKKEHKQGEGRSTFNAEVVFQETTGFVYV